MSFFTLFYYLLDLSCGECDVISLYFMCCSVSVSVCLACLTVFFHPCYSMSIQTNSLYTMRHATLSMLTICV